MGGHHSRLQLVLPEHDAKTTKRADTRKGSNNPKAAARWDTLGTCMGRSNISGPMLSKDRPHSQLLSVARLDES